MAPVAVVGKNAAVPGTGKKAITQPSRGLPADDALRMRDCVRDMLKDYQTGFFALRSLPDVVEDLRVLSLNAELAAGRAGEGGRAVRALTQHTRELVGRLKVIAAEMEKVRRNTYTMGGLALRGLLRMARMDRTYLAVELRHAQYGSAAMLSLTRARRGRGDQMREQLESLLDGGFRLVGFTAKIDDIINQADNISVNIAVLAAQSGIHEATFRTVANDMRSYVDGLRHMAEEVGQSVAAANHKAAALRQKRVDI